LNKLLNNPFFNAIKNIRDILEPDQRKRSLGMIALLFINAIFDVIGIASILPLINAALDPVSVQTKWYLRIPYEWIGVEDHITFMFILSAIIFFVFVIKNLITIFIFYIQARFSMNIAQRLSQNIFKYYYDQGYLHISGTESGKKNYDVITIPYYFSISYLLETLLLATEVLVLLIIFIAILFSNPNAMLILIFVIVPVFLGVYLLTKNKTKAIGDQRNKVAPQAISVLLDSFNAYTDVKLANKEAFFYENFRQMMRKMNDLDTLQQGIYSKIHQRINDIVLGLALMGIFGSAWIFRDQSAEIMSLLTVFGLAAYRFLPSVNRIMGSTLVLKNMSFVIEELKPVIQKSYPDFKEVEKLPLRDHISFQNIEYTYPTTQIPVLKGVSFDIKKGETIGIIGSSGSGKTTFLNLFLRLIHETNGKLMVDGLQIKEDKNACFQKAIGYVQQQVYIKNGTLTENIAFGEKPDETDHEKLQKVIRESMLGDFVAAHPLKEQMQLGENGVMLSGGQRQRVGIARALYKDSEILVFDEATSALDPETEKAIVTTINHLTRLNKTILIVAHRVTTLEMCDRIYEFKEGKVQGVHTYEELLKKFVLNSK
jgi:ABC-type multidrug transport system fused ATPase/permease subunit